MIATLLLFCLGIALLVRGADYFVEGAGGLAARHGVSPTTIGITVVAFGTSLPEFVVSINAIVTGDQTIALGNVLGSNIANIGLVLAVCALLRPMAVRHEAVPGELRHQVILLFAATVVYGILILHGVIDLAVGILFLLVFVFILRSLWRTGKKAGEPPVPVHGRMDYVYTVGGLAAVIIGSQVTLDGAIAIAETLGISTYIIGLSLVAVGTSLPELATSVMAIWKKNTGISVGNLLGSNIFNLLLVLGCGGLIRPIEVPDYSNSVVMGLFTLAVVPLFWGPERLSRVVAAALVGGYVLFILLLFGTPVG
ncbi:MAG: calcium/sodium antiporter [Methanomicrobiales archaeon]